MIPTIIYDMETKAAESPITILNIQKIANKFLRIAIGVPQYITNERIRRKQDKNVQSLKRELETKFIVKNNQVREKFEYEEKDVRVHQYTK